MSDQLCTSKLCRLRAFATLTIACSFLMLAISGLILFFMPHGTTILGLGKGPFHEMHVWTCFVALGAGVLHTLCNWATLKTYLIRPFGTERKGMIALTLALLIVIAAVAGGIVEGINGGPEGPGHGPGGPGMRGGPGKPGDGPLAQGNAPEERSAFNESR